MPIYEYVCKDCKAHFEVLVSLTSGKTIKCEKCSSLDVKKTVSASSFRMAGSGSSIPSGALSGCSSKSGFS
ncbi:MAG: zinc ribbon domain-containing protein [Desulfobulbaceae bacterium]|nr:zinc ribbon domain-containing protein [Desulfobulbaceae bacterium]